MEKILIPLFGDDVAPRFDLATEVMITTGNQGIADENQRIIVLPQASAEQLCHLILTEGVTTVICGGIEEEYHRYLAWKKVEILDSIIGTWKTALTRYGLKKLQSGDILYTLSK
jgi:predicted Fe-Mo cluster-binding NifX family protein